MNTWTVERRVLRGWKYVIVSSERQSWLNDGFTWGWYRLKSDAVNRANELNNRKVTA